MAAVEFFNKLGLVVTPFSYHPVASSLLTNTMNAAGESTGMIGNCLLSTGSGTSKTISSAGGKIWVYLGAVTWATVGSTLRVGIQDINAATGLEDGAWDVFDDLVQGTDAISANAILEVTMSSGTKTITHGDMIAVVIELTVRNGADSIVANRTTLVVNLPYTSTDTGALAKSASAGPIAAIMFDDGTTLGHMGDWTLPFILTTQNVAQNTTPDEYALVFEVPFECTINGLFFKVGSVNATDNATVHLIEDPFSADSNLVTVTLDPLLQGQTSIAAGYTMVEIAETVIQANVQYAVSYRPTNNNARNISTCTIPNAILLKGLSCELLGATRTDLGAWGSSSLVLADFGFRINSIETGGGTGSGPTSAAYLG